MTDQDPWRQQVERQLADLPYRVGQLESGVEETSSRQYQQSWDLQNMDRRLKDHEGPKPGKRPHG